MIIEITKKEFLQIARDRKNQPTRSVGFLIWLAPNGNYYKNEQTGGEGLKEMVQWNKNIADNIDGQVSLI